MMTNIKKLALLFSFIILTGHTVFSQKNDYLLIVGNDTISKEEFLMTYQKNNNLQGTTLDSLRNYLQLFTDFKLKVNEGKAQMLDTSKKFQRELTSYRNQSAQQYLIDKEVTDKLIDEAYEHYHYDLKASHILFNIASDKPADTLAAYKKALEVRNKILNKELTFAEATIKYSDDPSAKDRINPQNKKLQPGNQGDLGYFTVFNLVYPFEVAAYQLKVGEISMPMRTQFGYHLIYLTDKIPAIETIQAKHIYLADSLARDGKMLPATKAKYEMILKKLKDKVPFEELVTLYSDDKGTVEKGGELNPFSPQRRAGNFVKACLAVKPGEVNTQAVASHDGWHIIKVIDVKELYVNEDSKYALKNRIQRDRRSYKSKESLVEKLKVEYGYKEAGKAEAIKFFKDKLPLNYFQSTNIKIEELEGLDKLPAVFTFADQKVPATELASFISRFQGMNKIADVGKFIEEHFADFVSENILRYENKHLEEKYPEFKALVKEYHEGMILYEINSNEVWIKAIQDTIGLKNYYETHKSDYRTSAKDATPKPFEEVKSLVITHYQAELEKNWIASLREKYPVIVNEKVFANLLNK